MPANVYECMFILDTNKVAGDVPAAAQQLHTVLQKHHAEVLASRPWEERRLAYPIRTSTGNHKKGYYYLIYFSAEGKALTAIKQDFGLLSDLILRHMILHIDPKLADTMLALARDEHALIALRTMQNEPEDVEGMGGAPEGGGPPRRSRRPVEVGEGDKD